MRSSYCEIGRRLNDRKEAIDWLQFTYFLDFLIVECTGYKKETR